MRIFFLKALFFMIVISLSLNLLGTLSDTVAPLEDWRIYYQEIEADVKARNDRIEAITLGNSHADAIDYAVLKIEGQSMALGAADLFEVEKIVMSLDNRLPKLNTAFITISYYSFSWDNAKHKYLRPRRIEFYSLLPLWSPIDDDLPNFILGKLESYTHVMSVVRSDNWEGVWRGLLNDTPVTAVFPYDGVHSSSAWGECSHYTEEQLDRHARGIAGRNVSTSMQMANDHPGLERDSFAALSRTIEKLQSRGVRVILYTPTYYEKYTMYFADGGSSIIDRMKLAISQLQQTYGVEYYDFSNDPEFMTSPELFYNSDHLGECGHKAMTMKLLEFMGGNRAITH